jgi:hypothetical protein
MPGMLSANMQRLAESLAISPTASGGSAHGIRAGRS